jgi:hypothetical protein
MAVSGRHVPAGHHRGDDGDAHGGAGGERAADGGAGSTGRRSAGGPPAATLADRESALPSSRARHAGRLRSLEATGSRPVRSWGRAVSVEQGQRRQAAAHARGRRAVIELRGGPQVDMNSPGRQRPVLRPASQPAEPPHPRCRRRGCAPGAARSATPIPGPGPALPARRPPAAPPETRPGSSAASTAGPALGAAGRTCADSRSRSLPCPG